MQRSTAIPHPKNRLRARPSWIASACMAAAMGSSCTSDKPTEIVAGVSTQIQVPEYLKAVAVVVQESGRTQFCEVYEVANGQATLPATLGVLDEGARGPIDVRVLGLRTLDSPVSTDCTIAPPEPGGDMDRQTMVIRRRRVSFVDENILFLNLPLKESCRDVSCGPDQTCVGGACTDIAAPAPSLPPWDPNLIFGNTNTCFSGQACLPSGATLPVLLDDPETCEFHVEWPEELPQPSSGELNVRMFYDSFGSEVLDEDASYLPSDQQEGFSFPNPDQPLRFRLAPNLCQSNFQRDRIMKVEASALCPAKRALQPLCDDYVPPNPRADQTETSEDPAEAPGAGRCTMASLTSVESAVYVLMDRSARMSPFYGDGGLRFAVELPLASPVARQAQIGFDVLPALAAQCGTDDYAAPQVPFTPVEDAREPIGSLLSDPASVLPDDPAEVNLQAVLQGAYAGLRAVSPQQSGGSISRRALVLISNRDLLEGPCAGETAAVALVQDAANDAAAPVRTYAVALSDGDPQAQDATLDAATVASATALAQAGGTSVFNGVADEAEGATAVVDILTELGTCLYRVQRIDLGGNSASDLPEDATLSYMDPLQQSGGAIDIERNASCSASAGPEISGWAPDGEQPDLVRICGAACEELRRVTSELTALHLSQERVAPAVPVVVSANCDALTWSVQ